MAGAGIGPSEDRTRIPGLWHRGVVSRASGYTVSSRRVSRSGWRRGRRRGVTGSSGTSAALPLNFLADGSHSCDRQARRRAADRSVKIASEIGSCGSSFRACDDSAAMSVTLPSACGPASPWHLFVKSPHHTTRLSVEAQTEQQLTERHRLSKAMKTREAVHGDSAEEEQAAHLPPH